jgi:aminoglycoside 6'-N-acetyltransferase
VRVVTTCQAPGIRLRGLLTKIRTAIDDDVELLAGWHADPEIARYWDGETFSVDEMEARLARPDVDAYIVEAEGRPIGYLQAWRADDAGGLDMFLVPSARGRAYGPDAARALAAHLIEHGWTRVTVDPYVWNEQAVRAWRRAGFEVDGERPADAQHTAPWLLMEWRG